MASYNFRKDDELFRFDVGNVPLVFRKAEPIDFNRAVKIPMYKWMYDRYYTVLNEIPSNSRVRKREAVTRIRKELVEAYLYCDLCPKSRKSIDDMVENRTKTMDQIKKISLQKIKLK